MSDYSNDDLVTDRDDIQGNGSNISAKSTSAAVRRKKNTTASALARAPRQHGVSRHPSQASDVEPPHRRVTLLGGRGDVGTRLTRFLLSQTHARITVVSRRDGGADGEGGGRVKYRAANVAGPDFAAPVSAGDIFVNLTEATPPALVRQVVKQGGTFIETSATPDYLSAISTTVGNSGGPGQAILCVGVAPGLTNLLVAHTANSYGGIASVDIGLEMGFGRHYGAAATEWFLKTGGKNYPIVLGGVKKSVRPGMLGRRFIFGRGERARPALGYGFAEQVVLAGDRALGLSTVRSFVAIDPPIFTRGLGVLFGLGLGPAIAARAKGLTGAMARMPGFGKTRTRIVVEGRNRNGTFLGGFRLVTGDQADATAAMILATIQALLGRSPGQTPGLTTIADHLVLEQATDVLEALLPATRLERITPAKAQ